MKPLRSKAKLASAMSRVRRRRPVAAEAGQPPSSAAGNEAPGAPEPATRPGTTTYSLIGW